MGISHFGLFPNSARTKKPFPTSPMTGSQSRGPGIVPPRQAESVADTPRDGRVAEVSGKDRRAFAEGAALLNAPYDRADVVRAEDLARQEP
jgi:hypothetical protein